MQDKLLPNVKIELQIEMENDKNLVWRGIRANGTNPPADAPGESYRLIITRHTTFCTTINIQFRRSKVVLGKLPQTT